MVERTGIAILSVEIGSLSDIRLDPTTISGSFAFFRTIASLDSKVPKSLHTTYSH